MLATYLDPIGACLSLLCTISFVRVSRIAWLFGLVSTVLKVVLYFDRGLYAQVGLKLVFVVTMVYGWYTWRERGPKHEVLPIRYLSWKERAILIPVCGVGIWALNTLLCCYTDSTVSFMDSTTATLALAAQCLLCYKIMENWIFWFFINMMVVVLYADVGLPFNAAVHFGYIFLAIIGFKRWHTIMQQQKPNTGSTI
ncbi:MAG: nicotinamide riboside transporter PnuC [Pseudomonadota bacterium]